MGAKSTIRLTREECVKEIVRIVRAASCCDLENTLEALIGNKVLHNFMIVNEGESEYREGMFDHVDY